MQARVTKFDLSAHGNPQEIFQSLQKKYPDGNVEMNIAETRLEVSINPAMPTHLQINVLEFISDEIKRGLH